jgi:hypothetical protein
MSGTTERMPELASEAEERAYWEVTDSADRRDWSTAQRVRFVRLRPTAATIAPCLPDEGVK